MNGLIRDLEAMNAKERYWLLHAALGPTPLAAPFLEALCDEAGVNPPPTDAWWAMDFHLDWLACALLGGAQIGEPQSLLFPGWKLGTQEDVDLIVAWDVGEITHLLLVEAKGVTSHSNKQVTSKATKLGTLFGQDGTAQAGVVPHLVLASPTEPLRLRTEGFPDWCLRADHTIRWVELTVPNTLIQPVRCDESGKVTKLGSHWKYQRRTGSASADRN